MRDEGGGRDDGAGGGNATNSITLKACRRWLWRQSVAWLAGCNDEEVRTRVA